MHRNTLIEERSISVKGMISYNDRIAQLIDCMIPDEISNKETFKI